MRYLSCLLLLLVIGCGKERVASVDPIIEPYVLSFTQQVGVSVKDIDISFTHLEKNIVGRCLVDNEGNKSIQIDNKYWDSVDDGAKEQLIYHELGHCVLGILHHDDTVDDNHCPNSIMFPKSFGDNPCYKNHKPVYYKELKGHKGK